MNLIPFFIPIRWLNGKAANLTLISNANPGVPAGGLLATIDSASATAAPGHHHQYHYRQYCPQSVLSTDKSIAVASLILLDLI